MTKLEHQVAYSRTKKGLLARVYHHQVSSSKRRNHPKPDYTLDEFRDAFMEMSLYHELHADWEVNGYPKMLIPSVDRIDDLLPYTKDNIQLMTWQENKAKINADRVAGRVITKQNKETKQFTLDDTFITSFSSVAIAARETGITKTAIQNCCLGHSKTSGGFKWQYAS